MDPFGLGAAIVIGITGGVVWGGILGTFIRGLRNAVSRNGHGPARGVEQQEPPRAIPPDLLVPPATQQPVGPLWQNSRVWEALYDRTARGGDHDRPSGRGQDGAADGRRRPLADGHGVSAGQ